MPTNAVQVPVALLSSPDLSASAKLVWMMTQLPENARPSGRITASLSRPTRRRSQAQLLAAGWDPRAPGDRGHTVAVPVDLLTDQDLGIAARVLYGLLLLVPGFEHPCGRFTYAQLADMAQSSRNTAAKALEELVAAEWLQIERANRLAPISFQLTFPGFDRLNRLLAVVQKRLERANFYGEQLMREYLSLLVDSDDFEDDASPGFLTNPRTEERLQLDRFYPPRVAWEFNGPQHYRATERFSAEEVARQQERDYIKTGICVARGITLVVVTPEDLTLAVMREKVGNLLPLRNTSAYGPVADYLEAESDRYRRKVKGL